MKSKGAIQIFTVALALACLYYMSFSAISWKVQSDAKDHAQGNVEKERRYLDSMENEVVFDIGIASFTFEECRKNKLNLGLDLQGGMHVTLEVALDRLIKKLSGNPQHPTLNAALKRANEKQVESQDPYVDLFYESFRELSDGDESLFRVFDTRQNRGKFDREAEDLDAEVLDFIRSEADEAVQRTTDIIRTRIDEFGVTQPNIREEGSGRITIELPGVKDAQRIRLLLQQSAKLEFWETYGAEELVNNYFVSVNEVLADKLKLNQDSSSTDSAGNETEDPTDFFSTDSSADEDTTAADTLGDVAAGDTSDGDLLDMVGDDSLTNDTTDTSAAARQKQFAQNFPLYTKLQAPVTQQGEIQPGPVAGYANELDTALINEYLRYPEVEAVLPADIKFMWEVKPVEEGSQVYRLIALKTGADGSAPLTGKVIIDASQTYDMISGSPQVSMKMNAEGARIWKQLTGANIGKSIAISLDSRIYSFPNVEGEIPGGNSVINGNFTIEEAKALSSVLKAGKLPITVDIVEEAVVGPTLGKISIQNGLMSLVIGFLLVLVFMAVYYNRSGWVANVALLANLFFIIGILASLKAALTLPGMAGIVLTIGMSVDANVLIFERIREELKNGKSIKQAISDGYRNAYSSIIDANVTTLLTGIILLAFGKGPISGFAIILVIGILTSLFSAIFITRMIFDTMLKKEREVKFGTKGTMSAFSNFNFNFIGRRKIAYVVSGIIIAGGLTSLFTKGLNLSVDFEGGRSYVVQYDDNVSTTAIRNQLTENFGSAPEVKTFGAPNRHKIVTKYKIDDDEQGVDSLVQETLKSGIDLVAGEGKYEIQEGKKVGPTFARDIKVAAVQSILIGLVCIFIYILLRFRKWQFGLGALLALFHDVLIVLSLFSIFWNVLPFNLEVDQAFIAAILTVVGYSINDTVVVFDRIRESLGLHRKSPMNSVINDALNKTVSRTFITSITTLLVVLVLFIFGGEIIRGFSFALLIGILVGTYSSLFIATPVVIDFAKREDLEKREEE